MACQTRRCTCVFNSPGLPMSCRVSSLFSQPVSQWLRTVSANALELSVDALEPKRPRSVNALLHPVGCLAVREVLKVRRLPVQSNPCCSACTRQWCRSASGLHVVVEATSILLPLLPSQAEMCIPCAGLVCISIIEGGACGEVQHCGSVLFYNPSSGSKLPVREQQLFCMLRAAGSALCKGDLWDLHLATCRVIQLSLL